MASFYYYLDKLDIAQACLLDAALQASWGKYIEVYLKPGQCLLQRPTK